MPQVFDSLEVPQKLETVFTWFLDPANWLRLAPPELHLQIVAAPPRLEVGSQLQWKGRRWGVTHHSTVEITELEWGCLLIEEQRAGPFRQWQHIHRFTALDGGGTRLDDEVIFEPPGGMLGLMVTAAVVERELAAFFQLRKQRLPELLAAS